MIGVGGIAFAVLMALSARYGFHRDELYMRWTAAHVANTTACELLAWAALALVVARIGRTGDCRWWLPGGLVAGLGVADDHSAGFFAVPRVAAAGVVPARLR